MAAPTGNVMERIVALCKRRGFIFQSSEIYGGINGFWDYGPLGVELKRNIKDAWWQDMVRTPLDRRRIPWSAWTARSSCTRRCGRSAGTTTCSRHDGGLPGVQAALPRGQGLRAARAVRRPDVRPRRRGGRRRRRDGGTAACDRRLGQGRRTRREFKKAEVVCRGRRRHGQDAARPSTLVADLPSSSNGRPDWPRAVPETAAAS